MNRLSELRKAHKLSQAQLANICFVGQGTISNWESCKHDIDLECLKTLSSYFNVSTDYILGISDNPTSPAAIQSSEAEVDELVTLARSLSEADRNLVRAFVAGLKAARELPDAARK